MHYIIIIFHDILSITFDFIPQFFAIKFYLVVLLRVEDTRVDKGHV